MDREMLYRFFRNETTQGEEKKIMDWIDSDPSNRTEFEELRETYDILAVNAPEIMKKDKSGIKIRLGDVVKYAVAVAALVALIFGYGQLVKKDLREELAARTLKIDVPSGQRINVTLSDGTNVWLNADTKIEYPAVFNKERRVKLDGEAVFDVTHDGERPFIVETFACNLEVLGTKFCVFADRENNSFSTTLFEGGLRVTDLLSYDGEIIMKPNDKVVMDGHHVAINTVDNENDILWTEGLINLEGVSFEELLRKFEKYYDVKIVVERASMPAINVTRGKIKLTDGLEHALKMLQMSADFTYTRQNDGDLIIIR